MSLENNMLIPLCNVNQEVKELINVQMADKKTGIGLLFNKFLKSFQRGASILKQ